MKNIKQKSLINYEFKNGGNIYGLDFGINFFNVTYFTLLTIDITIERLRCLSYQ